MMNKPEAIEAISSGHAIYTTAYAREVCQALGVEFDETLVQVYKSDTHPLGVTMFHGSEEGVWSLSLSAHVANRLGVADHARRFLGRGSQAREYARVVEAKEALERLDAALLLRELKGGENEEPEKEDGCR